MPKLIVINDYTAGNTLPILKGNWGQGEVDITGWVITCNMRRTDASLFIKTATITDGAVGDFQFKWVTGDLLAGFQPAAIDFVTTGTDENFTVGHLAFDIGEGV